MSDTRNATNKIMRPLPGGRICDGPFDRRVATVEADLQLREFLLQLCDCLRAEFVFDLFPCFRRMDRAEHPEPRNSESEREGPGEW